MLEIAGAIVLVWFAIELIKWLLSVYLRIKG